MILNLLVVKAKDPKGLASFYEGLGMSFKFERHGKGPEHFAYANDGATFEIYPLLDGQASSGTRIGFGVSNLTDVFSKAVASNAVVVKEPASSPWGRRAVFRDPEGHWVELTEAASVR